jgi:hypothetical protein
MKRFIERASVNDAAPWRALLHEALHDQAEPVFTTEDGNIPPASIWTGSRLWTAAFRDRGMVSGDAVAIAVGPGPVFAQVLTAALFENLTIVLADDRSLEVLPDSVRVLITDVDVSLSPAPNEVARWSPIGISGPGILHGAIRVPREGDSGHYRIMSRRGSRWIGTSDTELLSLVKRSTKNLTGVVCDSSYPWIDRDSLVHGLLAPLAARAAQIVTRSGHSAKPSSVGRAPVTVPFPQLVSL